MSRQLPSRPNLEFLRKQAKDLLPDLQRRDPSAQLTDAQHALALEYGFASWPKLKLHVEGTLSGATSPFAGRWTADVAQSQRHSANEFRAATIIFDVDDDDVRITDMLVDADGREERHVNAIRVDGQEHVSANGYSLVARWQDSRTLETVGRKDGGMSGGATYSVSPDGRTMTIRSDQQVIVLNRGK